MRQQHQAARQQQHQVALEPLLLKPPTGTDLPWLRVEADLSMRRRALIKCLTRGRADLELGDILCKSAVLAYRAFLTGHGLIYSRVYAG